jgi:hypothetical protein
MAALASLLVACSDGSDNVSTGDPAARCSDFEPLRRAFFGDLHVHTARSFDSYAFDVRNGPDAAYRFARGEAVSLPQLDAVGNGTQTLQLDTPLDFAAVTEQEVESCVSRRPNGAGYASRINLPGKTGWTRRPLSATLR